jgi:tetratricopeptide (TPR) repeat protein
VNRFAAVLGISLSLACSASALAGSEEAIARNQAGRDLYQQGKVSEAITEFHKAVQEDANYLPARVNLAHSYEQLNRIDEAIQEYRGAIDLDPRHFFARNNLGVLYDKKGRHDEAIVEFEAALRSEPGNAMALKNLETAKKNQAIIKERQAQILRAEKEAQTKANDPRASYQAARLHAFYGNRDLALQWLQRALRQGYNELAYVNNDPAFNSLREDRDFQLLLLGK